MIKIHIDNNNNENILLLQMKKLISKTIPHIMLE